MRNLVTAKESELLKKMKSKIENNSLSEAKIKNFAKLVVKMLKKVKFRFRYTFLGLKSEIHFYSNVSLPLLAIHGGR